MVQERARLPCDVTSNLLNDRVVLILWYRGNAGTPIYSFDARGGETETGKHWSDERLLERRAYFQLLHSNSWGVMKSPGAYLEIYPVQDRDEAKYRCRVDYLLSPTKNTIINFTVVIPPNKPKIFNETGHLLTTESGAAAIIGPYNEGDPLMLLCKVLGGRPPPKVVWLMNGKERRSEVTQQAGGVIQITTSITHLRRNHLHGIFECRASNFNGSSPVSSSITLDMNFQPVNVSVTSGSGSLSANTDYELVCKAWGSRPSAVISWWKGGTQPLNDAVMTTTTDGNVTTSILKYRAEMTDNGKYLTCRAENKLIAHSSKEDGIKLNIHYKPVVTLQMGSTLDPGTIKEGDDVYFECHINANPDVYQVKWYHNPSNIILAQLSWGLTTTLVNSTRGQHGVIDMLVRVWGDNTSLTVSNYRISLQKPKQRTIQGAYIMFFKARQLLQQPPKPAVDEDFCIRLTLARHLCCSHFIVILSVLLYFCADKARVFYKFQNPAMACIATLYTDCRHTDPMTHLSLSITCYAFPLLPLQNWDYAPPYTLPIIPPGPFKFSSLIYEEPSHTNALQSPPDPPKNCTITNQTTDAIEVDCVPGFDGGLAQTFYMEVYDSDTGTLRRNLSSVEPQFLLTGLKPGIAFIMVTYASNAKGPSNPFKLETFTLKVAEKRTGPPTFFAITPVMGLLIGIVLALVLTGLVMMVMMKMRRTPPDPPNNGPREEAKGDLENLPLNVEVLGARVKESLSALEAEESNPDIIPHKNDGISYTDYEGLREGPIGGTTYDSAITV
ncbi:uncharacterized protein [Palaemon carinicauda]|uniref:uncharacterized protein n=1 Tax=Palaemon carinicauda TaxID=392227 RepID=UPI0035B69A6F